MFSFNSQYVEGLLGLVSIIMVGAEFDNSDLGWSFFLTVAAITIVLLQVYIIKNSNPLTAVQICTCISQAIFSTWKKLNNGLPFDDVPRNRYPL